MTLDGSFYVDDSGAPWLLYAHEWIQTTDGSFKALRLTDDLTATIGEPVEILRAKEDRFLGPLTVAQVISIVLVLGGAWLLARRGEAEIR